MSANGQRFSVPKFVPPLVILAVLLLVALIFFSGRPEAKREVNRETAQMAVEAVTLQPQDYPVQVQSYGTVQPRTQSLLVAQVSGAITRLEPELREGSFFKKGDLLLEIDPRDASANVKIAEASLMDARQALQEEKARAQQAAIDWKRLSRDEEPNELVLRKPQLLAAESRLVSAQANLDKARLALERTRVVAPFDGRVLQKFVDLGQVVSPNSQLAEIYATDVVEVRLPIRNRDLVYIDLPETYSDAANSQDSLPDVTLRSNLISSQSWLGKVVRTEGAIDTTARQLHVVAQIDQPFAAASNDGATIKIGQYVTAMIEGRTVNGALVIPDAAVYQNSFVYLVEDNRLQRKTIDIAWQNSEEVVVAAGLEAGQRLVVTPLGQITSGTPVRVEDATL